MTEEQKKILDSIRICCKNSAAMLEMADRDAPNLNELNKKQAMLLWECARLIADMPKD